MCPQKSSNTINIIKILFTNWVLRGEKETSSFSDWAFWGWDLCCSQDTWRYDDHIAHNLCSLIYFLATAATTLLADMRYEAVQERFFIILWPLLWTWCHFSSETQTAGCVALRATLRRETDFGYTHEGWLLIVHVRSMVPIGTDVSKCFNWL